MYIRKFKQEDLCRIEQIHSFLAVQIKYHNGIRNENIVCVIKDEMIIGVGFLIIHQTRNLQKTEVTYSASPDGGSKYNKEIRDLLMDGLLKRFRELKEENPNSHYYLRICCDTEETEEMQALLKKGFAIWRAIPVLKYDLSQEILHYKIPENIHIAKYCFDERSMDKYLKADFSASTELDSEADLWFQTGNPGFACYTAVCDGEIAGAVSVWDISDGRGATENIFVVPEYRRKNIARELIATALEDLKERNRTMATLSVIGTNGKAIMLYLSCGYTLYYNLIEMIYEHG